ncbi:MAG: hypothetical protein GY810_20955 [Aureispira sp.]|nr:hypothetical protein [Aureispira sp.]
MSSTKLAYFVLAAGLITFAFAYQLSIEYDTLSFYLETISAFLIYGSSMFLISTKNKKERKIALVVGIISILITSTSVSKNFFDPLLHQQYAAQHSQDLDKLADLLLNIPKFDRISFYDEKLAIYVDCTDTNIVAKTQQTKLIELMEQNGFKSITQLVKNTLQYTKEDTPISYYYKNRDSLTDSKTLTNLAPIDSFLIELIGHKNCVLSRYNKDFHFECILNDNYTKNIQKELFELLQTTHITYIRHNKNELIFALNNNDVIYYPHDLDHHKTSDKFHFKSQY